MPPPALRYRVHGAFGQDVYRQVGQAVAESIVGIWRRYRSEKEHPLVLDFGCGPGRVATEVKGRLPAAQLQGCDIDREAIEWAASHLADIGTFRQSPSLPPTHYADDSFDLVYSVSVFTHLDENQQILWLEELARLVKPDGLVIATVHGIAAQTSCSSSEMERLQSYGFAYRVDRKGLFKLDGLPDCYQTSFHSRSYVERVWGRRFEILDYAAGGLMGHQDLIVLKRPK
jgi:SAM-dependent methyltransferase